MSRAFVKEEGGEADGDDGADVARGRVSWVSPLARALLGHGRSERVRWERPDGACELEILDIEALPEHG